MMKKKILLMAAFIAVAAILTIGSLAYFTAEDKAVNVITTGDVAIELEEWMVDPDGDGGRVPFPEGGVSQVMPGTDVSKIVQVKNTGSNAAYIRLKVDKSLKLEDPTVSGVVDLSLIVLDVDNVNWTLKEGFYYYNQALQPGETTTPLFTEVFFKPNMNNMYQGSIATVDVTAYAVQEANNGGTVFDAVGWPVAP